ncbi:Formamidopyrimidine-DNA glycosylase [Dissostichus eleginoides]|uniref:Formamidopyrimidine-DNA glycosylase n=1 Tax=Dissostichus eleginoides TaxID=100907 RepID=A0AAD9CPT0_DISEL|nr:Formamidopyrimidine-DNA glycosylase [Dissostichus eleginoides]
MALIRCGSNARRCECEAGRRLRPPRRLLVHQGVHIKHPQQQHAGHRRGRHRLIGCLTGADVTENSRARVHLYLPHLHRWTRPGRG